MGIDAKDACMILWKILSFTTNTICLYLRRYPVASGVSGVLIILYICLPWVFYFLLCASPLIACASFYLWNHLKIGDSTEEEKRTDRGFSQEASVSAVGRTVKAELKHQRSVRRNARGKVEEVGTDWDSSEAREDERGKVILTTLYGELPETITPDLETFKRKRSLLVAEDSFVKCNLDNEEDFVFVDPLERMKSVGGDGEIEVECSSSDEEEEEEEEEEETHGDRNTVVVAWTEDDQKNLMDLGTSEIERNKRLETLISRRRSKRLFLLADEGSLTDMEVPRVCIGRNYYGLAKENYEIDGLLMPGSAPSVLLPRRNPFDLPYDPLEEKPNLSGDSFHQEFTEAKPKDTWLSRHESFHHRSCPSRFQKDSNLTYSWRNPIEVRPSPLQGGNDQLPIVNEKDLTREEGDDLKTGEVRIETHSIRNEDSDSNSTLSPRETEKDFNVSDLSDASGSFSKRTGQVGKSLMGLVPRTSGSNSLASARQKYMEHFGYNTRKCHMVTHSVDSDLQVEVSELGSPPTSIDGNYSSDVERSLFIYESEIGKDMAFNGEESEMLNLEKADKDLNETDSPENEEAGKVELMVPQLDEELKKNSADEINISYDSDEPVPSERADQEYEEPCESIDQDIMQILVEDEGSDVNHHGNSKDSATSPSLVLPDMLPVDQIHSEDLDHTSDGQLRNVDLPK